MPYNLPPSYTNRTEPAYFDDVLPDSSAWQADVYRLAAELARRSGAVRLVDLGCGRGEKLAAYRGQFEIVGIDYGANIDACKAAYPFVHWQTVDLNRQIVDTATFENAVVICADVIEHLPTPDALIESLRSASGVARVVLVSTPDRMRVYKGLDHAGPPGNPYHVREWSQVEFETWLTAEKLPVAWSGWTISNDARPDQVWTSLVILSNGEPVNNLPPTFEPAPYWRPKTKAAPQAKHNGSGRKTDLKVWMTPTPSEAARDSTNAIHQIVMRLHKHLPDYGIELVEQPDNADLRAGHAGQGSAEPIDVAHYHGLYPTGMGMDGVYYAINTHVIRNLKTARAITAPSEWIADVIRRDMHINPHVIGWGVDTDEWQPVRDPHLYVIWNKARTDWVSDPTPMLELAKRMPDVPFLTTFGTGGPNIRTIGRQPYAVMKEHVRNAGVYLSTNVETFCIGAMEAMASGVPILGFRQGAIAEYLTHGVNAFLAEPGDIDGLVEGLHYCLKYRDTLGANARELAKQFPWSRVAEQMAAVYRQALEPHQGARCSVVIPCHNYGHYVAEAIESALAQQASFDYEIIVVLDRCTDNSAEVVNRYANRGVRALTVDNGSLSATRNDGIRAATGEYIACLDADDHIGSPLFLQTLADALDADRTLGIAFTSIRVMDADGNLGHLNAWPHGYDFDLQAQRRNQIPSLCLFRKAAWRRAGGFRPHFKYAEDAEFWTTVGAIGYGAKHVVEDGWFHYRLHANSASRVHRTGEIPEPDWTEFHPWTKDGQRPFAADGKAPHGSWPVRFYNEPDISVIIPVGPGHEEALKDALHSVEGQTHRFWECIVVNDTDSPLCLEGFPWAKIVETRGQAGAGAARNLGAKHSKAPFLVFLDADDLLKPRFLEATLRAFRQSYRYAYTDWMTDDGRGKVAVHPTPEYSFGALWEKPSIHAITALIPRQWFEAVGGFDEQLSAFEDVDFFLKLLTHGYCGVRVAEPLLLYNLESGQRRAASGGQKEPFKKLLDSRYGAYMRGEKMCDCIEPPKGKQPLPPTLENAAEYKETYGEPVKVQYTYRFAPESPVTFRGPGTKVFYGARAKGDIFYIWEADFQAGMEMFTKVESYDAPAEPTVVPPAPELISVDDVPARMEVVEQAFDQAAADLAAHNAAYAEQFDYPIDNGLAGYAPHDKAEEWISPADEGTLPALSAMSKAELKRYAADHGVDLTGARTNDDIRERIRSAQSA